MICVTVTPESRTLAKADILNASRQGDIIELCLDHLVKEPDVKDLLSATTKPILVSCRRQEDGGKWEGTEEERLLLLRQAIVAGPAYIELDLETAPKIPRFGKTQRVISFTRLDQPETDIDSVFDDAAQAKADVVKFVWPTPTMDDAWPLLVAISQKRRLPIVGLGLGRADLTFSLLGRKCGSPWLYAALERGMEAYPGQATVFELDEIYHWREIDSKTVLVAVAGFGLTQTVTTKILNAGFKELGINVRCLPIVPGKMSALKQMIEALKIRAVIVGSGMGRSLFPLAEKVDANDAKSQAIDLLLKRDDGWNGYNSLWRSGLKTLEQALGKTTSGQKPLEQRNVLVLGNGPVAESMIYAVTQRKGLVSACGPNDKESQRVAADNSCRYVPYQNLYDTLCDVVIVADASLQSGMTHGCVNPSFMRPHMTVLDVSDPPKPHALFVEAGLRNCKTIPPQTVFSDQINAQFKAITGKDLSAQAIEQGLALLENE